MDTELDPTVTTKNSWSGLRMVSSVVGAAIQAEKSRFVNRVGQTPWQKYLHLVNKIVFTYFSEFSRYLAASRVNTGPKPKSATTVNMVVKEIAKKYCPMLVTPIILATKVK
jgi:hypothetical protein